MNFSAAALLAALEDCAPAAATGLCVGLSGGADSAALLAALAASGFRSLPLRALHVDHGLQAAAPIFCEACVQLCARLAVPLSVISVTVDVAGVSIEAAARAARYEACARQLKSGECLLTAHHREDQAETLLLQLFRGAGLKGLSAMPCRRPLGAGWHLRPLLEFARGDLHRYTALSGIAAVTDPMNHDRRFDRAYLRSVLWPLIEQRWPGAAGAVSRSARHVAQAQSLLDHAAAIDVRRLRDGDALAVPGLRALPPAAQINALRYWISSFAVTPPSAARVTEALRQIFEAHADHLPAIVWGEHALRRYRERLFLTAATPPRIGAPREWLLEPGSRLDLGPDLGGLRWTAQAGGLDAARLPGALNVRQRGGGEILKPARHAKTRSVQHWCQSWGVLPWMRDALPMIYAGDALIAIGDLAQDVRWCAAAGEPGFACVWEDAPIIV